MMAPSLRSSARRSSHPPVIYYGTDLPSRERARRLRNAVVVLQTYHPLCESNGFADYFPHARRFVYFNPTATQTRLLTDPRVRAATLDYDITWDLERLDLHRAAARRFAIAQGHKALSIAGVHGLFVDDLDRWDHPIGRRHAMAVLRAIDSDHSRPVAWFVNRGFGFWKWLPGMAAALLEDLSPYHVDRMTPGELDWLTTLVLPTVRRAHAAGAQMYCQVYDRNAGRLQPHSAPARALAALTGDLLVTGRHFDRWPRTLTEENNQA